MGNKHVEYFHASSPFRLEEQINWWAEDHKLEPVSISVLMDKGEFVAFVVMEERGEDSYD